MTRSELVTYMRVNPLATVATVSADGRPESALVAVAVSDGLEVVFDTLDTSRKFVNIKRSPQIAIVVGTAGPYETGKHDERSLQYEGIADIPTGDELAHVQETIYFKQFPDGRSRAEWPHMTYVRVRPTWLRYSDYNVSPPLIVELNGDDLKNLVAEP